MKQTWVQNTELDGRPTAHLFKGIHAVIGERNLAEKY